MIRGFLIDIKNSNPYVAEIDGSLDSLYAILNCSLFDIASRKIGDRYFDIYCDDEGLLKCDPQLSAMSPDHEPILVGNLFIVNHDDEGGMTSLSEEEIDLIKRNLTPIFDDTGRCYPCLVCEY